MTRTLWLVFVAMVMFSVGVVVMAIGNGTSDRLLAGVAILGAVAVVVANVYGNGKGNGH